MSVSRRVLPDSPGRRGWCPGLVRPMPTGDGLLARIHPPLGILSLAQLRAVADAARRFGNGHVDVTARANLQLRGVTDASRAGLVAALERAGLGDVRADGGPQRLTLTSPRAGLSPALIDVPALARSIEAHGLVIAGLPAKTLVLIEGGGATDLPGIAADIHVKAIEFHRVAIGLADGDGIAWIAACGEADIAGAVTALLRAFAETGRRRVRDLAPDRRTSLVRAVSGGTVIDGFVRGFPFPGGKETRGQGSHPSHREGGEPALASVPAGDRMSLEVEAPFGRCTVDMLDRLPEAALALGAGDIRLSPTRGFVLRADACDSGRRSDIRADLAAAGFVATPDDPRRAVAACPGAPACGSGSTPTGADAARLAAAFRPFADRGLTAHVSGCAKGCAHPGRADLTLVGRAGRYGIVLDGLPGDAPALDLTFEAALERVCKAKSGTLAQAFRDHPFGTEPFAEPAVRTTT